MGKRMRTRQLKVIQLLIQGCDSQEITQQMKLRWSTLSRWRRQPEFMARLEEYKHEVMEDTSYSNEWWMGKLTHCIARGIEKELFSDHHYSNLKKVETALSVLKHATGAPKSAKTGQNVPKLVITRQNLAE
jgi:hypothetical protein